MKRVKNNKFKLLILAGLALCGTSCSDFLDQKPGTSLPAEEAVKDLAGLKVSLNGLYDGLQESEGYYGARMMYYGDVKGDIMQAKAESKRSSSLYEMKYTLTNAPTTWDVPYDVIRRACNIIKIIEENKIADLKPADSDPILGQAYAVRALVHFDLCRMYGKPYTEDNGASLGVPIVTSPLKLDVLSGRNKVSEVYEQVIKDLTFAITKLGDKKTPGYMNVWSAKALLARVYLYKGDNVNALKFAEDVIDNSPYKLFTTEEYKNAWGVGGNSENLFEIVNASSDDWVDREAIGYLMSEEGYDDLIVTPVYLDLMKTDLDDVRWSVMLPATAKANVDLFGTEKVYLAKYPGRNDNVPVDTRVNNVPVLRLSETYLIAAEAAVKPGAAFDQGKADKYLNKIRQRANPAKTAITATIDNVLEERAKELFGEGHRLFDLLRNGKDVDRTNRWEYPLKAESVKFDKTYFRILMPIPSSECDANPVIAAQQNSGY